MSNLNSLMVERAKSSSSRSSFYLENDFFHAADILRAEFERLMSISVPANSGLTPFSYAFCRHEYQFLTASAERIFASDVLDDLIGVLRAWGNRRLGTSHVSTPQFRVYISGCSRSLVCDDVNVPWRYILSLTKNGVARKGGAFNILTDHSTSQSRQGFSIGKLMNCHLHFNQMLVHRASSAYSIEALATSMNLTEGLVFLDGYFW